MLLTKQKVYWLIIKKQIEKKTLNISLINSFYLWWKENLSNIKKLLKYNDHNCKIFFCFLCLYEQLQLLKIGKNVLIFQKNALDQIWKAFNTKVRPQLKDPKSSFYVGQALALFCNLVALILG